MPHQAVSCAVAPLPPMACAHGCHGGLVQRPPVLARAHMRAAESMPKRPAGVPVLGKLALGATQ